MCLHFVFRAVAWLNAIDSKSVSILKHACKTLEWKTQANLSWVKNEKAVFILYPVYPGTRQYPIAFLSVIQSCGRVRLQAVILYFGRRLLMHVRLKNRIFENIYIFMAVKTLLSPVGSYYLNNDENRRTMACFPTLRTNVRRNQTYRGKGGKFDFFYILMSDRLGYN